MAQDKRLIAELTSGSAKSLLDRDSPLEALGKRALFSALGQNHGLECGTKPRCEVSLLHGTSVAVSSDKIRVMHRYLLHNSEIRDTEEKLLSPAQAGLMNGWGVFSTLRVSEGVLFAYERHYERMVRDAARMRVPFDFSSTTLEDALLSLVEANRAFNATLRVAVVRNRGGLFDNPGFPRDSDLIAFTADLVAWGKGVRLSYMPHGRHGASRFAGSKITSWAQNVAMYEEAHERGFDEVILLNEFGQISECTSANIFVIQEDRVWTPPVETSGCLPGVTRAILLEEIQDTGLVIGEKELTPSDLEESDQVFITSTTRDLLPVLEIDHLELAQCPESLNKLSHAFSEYRVDYIADHAAWRETLTV